MTLADQYISEALSTLGIPKGDHKTYWDRFDEIRQELDKINDREGGFAGQTTGTITERHCDQALKNCAPDSYYRLTGKDVKWLGDYVILGYPLNVVVSVKSYSAKERALVSGSGSTLTPTILFALFKDIKEFKREERIHNYILRGFIAIYIPPETYKKIPVKVREMVNINGNPLLREIASITQDIEEAMKKIQVGKNKRNMVDISKL